MAQDSSSCRGNRLAIFAPWLLIFSGFLFPVVVSHAASSSAVPLIPKTVSSPAVPSAASSHPSVPHVQRPTVKDVYDDNDLTSQRLCRHVGGDDDDILHRVFGSQCNVPIGRSAMNLPPSSWSPWTHPPTCSVVNTTASTSSSTLEFCVFTHSHYGGGVSIVATPETASGLATILDQASIAQPLPPIDRPLLDIQDIPGKDLGVVAGEAIPRGTVLLRDRARVLADVRFPQHVRRAHGQTLLHKTAARLTVPDDVRGLSRSVKAKPGEARGVLEENVLSTNSFATTVDGVAYMALFPEIAVCRECHCFSSASDFVSNTTYRESTMPAIQRAYFLPSSLFPSPCLP